VKITYLNKREGEKRFRGVIWGQKLTLNHPSLVDEGEEIRVSVDDSQKSGGRETVASTN
jgi:2-oxoglutarate dehydrogenase complex dehydrogenase (E1) component-like enzyme